MADEELRTILHDAAPPVSGAPDVASLWEEGRRRRRRRSLATRSSVAAAAIFVVLAVGVSVAVQARRSSDLLVADGPVATREATTGSRAPGLPPDADLDAPGFPFSFDLSRTEVGPGDAGEVEGRLVPREQPTRVGDSTPVTVAIPLTVEAFDPVTGRWQATHDLYDMSRNDHAYWQPHGTGPAWYEWAFGPHGFPLRLPVDELAPGSHRVCARAWRSGDDPPGAAPTPPPPFTPGATDPATGPGFSRPSDASSLDRLTVPASAVTLCRALTVRPGEATSGKAPAPPSSTTVPPAASEPTIASTTPASVTTSVPQTPTSASATTRTDSAGRAGRFSPASSGA